MKPEDVDFTAQTCVGPLAAFFPDCPDSATVAVAAVGVRGGIRTVTTAARGDLPPFFEIGGLKSTMIGVLLAGLVLDGVVDLEDDVARWIPTAAGRGLTLKALATHTSGLPRLAPNHAAMTQALPGDPYLRFDAALIADGIAALAPADQPAPQTYSRFGYQILGLALERAGDQAFSRLLENRLTSPLGMTDTDLGPVGVRSTLGDMARYLDACADPQDDRLGRAIRLAQTPLVTTAPGASGASREVGLAWIRWDGSVLWHDGAMGGHSSALAVDVGTGRALVVLADSVNGAGNALARRVFRFVREGR